MPRNGPKRSLVGQQATIDAARDLMAELGPGAVSIDQIAARAGVGKATIYRWWPSKSAVMIDALEQWCESENPPPDTGNTKENIRQQMHRVTAIFASPIGATIRQLIADSQSDQTIAQEFRARFFDLRESSAMATIQAGIDSGELRPDLDPGTAVDMLYGPLWLRLLIEHRPLTTPMTDRVLEQAWPTLVKT